MSKSRATYHTTIKLAYALKLENKWLPDSFIKSIPRSTSHAWKTETKEKYVGYEYAETINNNLDELKLALSKQLDYERKLFVTYARIKITLIQILGKEHIKATFAEHFRIIVKLIEHSGSQISGGVKTVCGFLDVKTHLFYYWKNIAQYRCTISPIQVCLKKVPAQATVTEIGVIRSLLNRKRLLHWPICSVWAYARRNNHTELSLSSWYRYNRQFSIRNKVKKGKYKKKYDSLKANEPNEIWHADITVFRTLDGVKHYIYLIIDNYSRFYVNYKVADKCNGAIRAQTFREAIAQEFGHTFKKPQKIELIVDGGTENNNNTVDQFIKESNIQIDKKIALKDIRQSNSMIEAANKTIKHHYLFKKALANIDELRSHLRETIYDVNYRRPNAALGIYTPYEIISSQKPTFLFRPKGEVIKSRHTTNKGSSCSHHCT